ncbi:hypothetical protein HER10_EVM0001743 [Colletotrichum scovillei]|uniref:uncharacterized protein n=1 Tax=Colletotrichum scovillei TaxID=1209932 RepID=UPI0015C35ADE|nr:uncharacterized protein HER10_EVM0001743 [Colletotrichum scovillei]KAF4781668.1 hypothetical protein HER10_EVM0001743 [Colletotrichum scovillei]
MTPSLRAIRYCLLPGTHFYVKLLTFKFKSSAVNDTSHSQTESGISADKPTALLMLESRVDKIEETCIQLKADLLNYHRMAAGRQTKAIQQQIQNTQAAQDKHIQYLIACEDARDASKNGSNASEDERYQRHKELQDRFDELTMKSMRYDEMFISQATRIQRMDALGQNLAICTALIVVILAIVGYAVSWSWD